MDELEIKGILKNIQALRDIVITNMAYQQAMLQVFIDKYCGDDEHEADQLRVEIHEEAKMCKKAIIEAQWEQYGHLDLNHLFPGDDH